MADYKLKKINYAIFGIETDEGEKQLMMMGWRGAQMKVDTPVSNSGVVSPSGRITFMAIDPKLLIINPKDESGD